MKHVGPVRRELGVPSIMNLLGPLANPAGVRRQVVGVADLDRAPLMAQALARLGADHALVVHGRPGLDEVSPLGVTAVWEIRGSTIDTWEIDPRRLGLETTDAAALRGGEPGENAARVERLLEGGDGDAAGRAAVLLNAAAAIYVAGLVASLDEAVERARTALSGGAARAALERLRRVSVSTSG